MSKEEKPHVASPSPICTACFDFTLDGVKHERRTIVIVPRTIQEIDSETLGFTYACSRGSDCRDKACRYSYAWKRKTSQRANEEEDIEPFGVYGDR